MDKKVLSGNINKSVQVKFRAGTEALIITPIDFYDYLLTKMQVNIF
jgi:hypothetical protein